MEFIAISVLLLTVAEASFCINKTQQKNFDLCQAVKICCPDEQVIYRPDITASDQSCDSKQVSCMNRTIDLLVDISECYWKQSCTIGFPTTPMLGCDKAVESLRVNNWKCVDRKENPKSVYGYVCDNITDLGPEMTHGVIRSHDSIPWKYDRNTFSFRPQYTVQFMLRCNKTIHLRRGMDEQFLVSVDFIDLDTDNDQFTINGEIPYNGYNKIFTELDEKILFSFTMNVLSTKGGSGFVVCFKKLMKGEKSMTSACDDIMTTKTEPVTSARSSNPYCPKKGLSPERNSDVKDKSSLDKVCKSMLSLYTSTTVLHISSVNQTLQTTDKDFCDKCLSRKTIGKRCSQKCCHGQSVATVCTATINQPTCPANDKKVKKLCKKCRRRKKCNKRFRERCMSCCSGRKGNLENCQKSGKTDGKNKKGKKARGRKGRKGQKKN